MRGSSENTPFSHLFLEPQKNGLTRPKAVRGAGVKMVNMGELFAFDRIRNCPMDRVPLNDHERHFLLRPGDLLFARQSLVLAGAGRCVLFQGDSEEVTFESHIIRIRLDAERACPSYYYYWFRSREGRERIASVVTQVAAAGIRGSDLANLTVPFPRLEQQVGIASILGALDDKIELNRRMNKTLEELARTIFKSWFVDFDPVKAKVEGRRPEGMDAETAKLFPSRFVESELGMIPEGWTVTALGDHVRLQRGTTYNGQLVGLPGPALLGLGSIEPGGGFRDGHYKTYGGECPEKLTLIPGDLFVALKGATKDGTMVGSVARVPQSVPSGRLTQDTVKLSFTSSRGGLERYVYRLLLTAPYRAYCAGRITGSAQVGFSREDFLGYPFCLPPPSLLIGFAEIDGILSRRIESGNVECGDLAALRDLLLPKLISGELRVPDAEKLAEAAL